VGMSAVRASVDGKDATLGSANSGKGIWAEIPIMAGSPFKASTTHMAGSNFEGTPQNTTTWHIMCTVRKLWHVGFS
jgi:hypothetical protein